MAARNLKWGAAHFPRQGKQIGPVLPLVNRVVVFAGSSAMLVGIAAGLATPRIRDESNIADGFVLVTFAVMACRTRYGKVPREWNVKTWPQFFPFGKCALLRVDRMEKRSWK